MQTLSPAAAYVPAGQSPHAESAVRTVEAIQPSPAVAHVPVAGRAAQALASSAAENFPAAQAVQAKSVVVVPAMGSSPAPQVVVAVWSAQEAAPAVATNLPASQAVQVVPVSLVPVSVMEPAGQSMQTLSPAAAYVPAGQLPHAES